MTIITYSIASKNYSVDSNLIPADVLQQLTERAAGGSVDDLLAFVAILATCPASSYKILSPNPMPLDGPYTPLDQNTLDLLGMDTVGIIALAMLICLQIESELRKMGLEMSQQQQNEMLKAAADELAKALKANDSQFWSDVAGAITQAVSAATGGLGGLASFVKTGKGALSAEKAKQMMKEYRDKQANFDNIRQKATSDAAYADDVKEIQAAQRRVDAHELDIQQSQEEIGALRKKVLSGDNPVKRADDEAYEVGLRQTHTELQAAKKAEQDAANDLKRFDDGLEVPDGVDRDIYRATLENRLSDARDNAADLQARYDNVLAVAKRDHPAAAASVLEAERYDIRSSIASKEVKRLELEEELAPLEAKKKERDEALAKGIEAEKFDNDDARSEAKRIEKLKGQLDATKAEIAGLRTQESRINQELDQLVADKRAQLVTERQALEYALHATEDEASDLKTRRDNAPPGSARDLLDTELGLVEQRVAARRRDLEEAEQAIVTHDLDHTQLQSAESRLSQKQAAWVQDSYQLQKLETSLDAAKAKQKQTFAEEQYRLDELKDLADIEDQKSRAAVEEAGAWRVALGSIGQFLGAIVDMAGKAAQAKVAADERAQAQNIARLFEVLQIAQGIWASLGDNSLQYINSTRATFAEILKEAAQSTQGIAKNCA